MEYFDIYDNQGNHIGQRLRSDCHGNPSLLHRAVHVVVFHPTEPKILLQKRSQTKDIQPGKWDTAVGGHLNVGEDYLTAAHRELGEELGVTDDVTLTELFDSQIRNDIESEDIRVFKLIRGEGFKIQESELDAIGFWSYDELFDETKRQEFTPNLCVELDKLKSLGYLAD